MEIIYPDNFLRYYNDDDEIDDVGEFELTNSFDDFVLVDESDTYDQPTTYRGLKELSKQMGTSIGNAVHYIPDAIETTGKTILNAPPINYVTRILPFPPGHGGGGFNPNQPPMPGGNNSSPMGPPPSYIPSQNDKNVKFLGGPNTKSVSPPSIRPCLFRFTYIWQTNGRSYWAYLIRIDRRSVSGWRWMGWRWVYFGLDLNRIESFVC